MKKLFFWCLVVISAATLAQEITTLNPTLENFVPSAPEVSAIQKFGNYPVSESTGVPSLSVPIYSYSNSTSKLALSISLDYHLGGVKVNERASREGLGWALNAGGVISRSVRGIYDEEASFGFINYSPPQTEDGGNVPSARDLRPFNRMYANVQDSQADVFSYSFGGKSGKFQLGRNGDLLLLNMSNIKIEKYIGDTGVISDGIIGFTITDDDGLKYYFNKPEITQTWVLPNHIYTTSWFLTKIESLGSAGKSIDIEYEEESMSNYSYSTSQTSYNRVDGTGNEIFNSNTSSVNIQTWRVKKIKFPNEVNVDFQYSTTSPNEGHLSSITVTDDQDKEKGFLFDYDQSLNRLTLKSVTPFADSNTNTMPPYTFEYIGSLPSYFSTGFDHWGYNNGSPYGGIPREVFPNGLGHGIWELPGISRDTDSTYVKYGSLKKISYPTGGATIFDMEANQAEDDRLDQEFTINETGPGYEEKTEILTIDSDVSYGTNVLEFLFNGDPNTVTPFEIDIQAGSSCTNCSVIAQLFYSTSDNYPIEEIEIQSGQYGSTGTFQTANLIPGHYYSMVFYTQNMSDYYSYVTVTWQEADENSTASHTYSHKQPFVGGLRVKRILNYDGIHPDPVTVKSYSYKMPDGTSSGTLGVFPVYTHTVYYENRHSIHGAYNYPAPEAYVDLGPNVIVRSNNPINDLGYANGSPVIYKRVEVKSTSLNGSLGKEVKYFTNFKDSPINLYNTFPYVPTVVDQWGYGLLLNDSIYNSNGDLIKSINNQYKYKQDTYFHDAYRFENFRSVSIAPVVFFTGDYVPSSGETPPLGTPLYFKKADFYPSAGRADLEKTVTVDYTNGEPITNVRKYQLDDVYHKLRYQTVNKSNGDSLKVHYRYSFDLLGSNDPNGAHQYLYNHNDLSTMIEEETSLTSQSSPLVYSVKKMNVNGGGKVIVDSIQVQKKGSVLKTSLINHAYDSHGNPLEVSKADGTHISYVWGYNSEYPVAKIENATQAQVATANLNMALINNTNTSDTDMRTELNKLRTGLPGAMVSTYTYAPLVGVTSMTDPKGYTMFYEYDDFNRLEFVRDADGNLLSENKYYYKN
ncbi:hypothetical protein [Flavivirga sp. 57AJ16]|uniref:hypothetical protein n=1 Tax=Flavivirga sp. 57AJ16 TaxID=3025307 RepID=UPI0023658FC0|nr:hypothetical protein [Flavivirga sp. 57AJ16]MDD7887092.1 hypothetical protein [Flavivirga sp. 57AJ16]